MAANRCVCFSLELDPCQIYLFSSQMKEEKRENKSHFLRDEEVNTQEKKIRIKIVQRVTDPAGRKERERDESIYIFDWYNNDEMKKVDEEREKSGGEKRTETHSSSPQTQNEID